MSKFEKDEKIQSLKSDGLYVKLQGAILDKEKMKADMLMAQTQKETYEQ